ncbi:MAG: epimerase [Bacteroides sp. SM23_62]|nr:MAG: epimerase [Bacteroides sp. SM23_62]
MTIEEIQKLERIENSAMLEDILSTPDKRLQEDLNQLNGDIMILGVGGKVGPTLSMMAKRAVPDKRVIGVARFSDPDIRKKLERRGVETIQCDLLEQEQVEKLPQVRNIIYMAGKKFETDGMEPFTWAMNAVVPSLVGRHFKNSRLVVFSTLCVYPFAAVTGPGWDESCKPTPLGEYPNSCVARERIFQYYVKKNGNSGCLVRLNYAIDLRYGVLHDIAKWILNDNPIAIGTAKVNIIWQGDSTNRILRCLLHCTNPATPINIGYPENSKVRELANRFGEIFGKKPRFAGTELDTAWINDNSLALSLFGEPAVDIDTMIRWNADWISRDMPVYNKPTCFEVRDGVF